MKGRGEQVSAGFKNAICISLPVLMGVEFLVQHIGTFPTENKPTLSAMEINVYLYSSPGLLLPCFHLLLLLSFPVPSFIQIVSPLGQRPTCLYFVKHYAS